MNQEIKELSVLQASDASFIVRETLPNGQITIRTFKEFPELIKGLEKAFFDVPVVASPQPAQTQ